MSVVLPDSTEAPGAGKRAPVPAAVPEQIRVCIHVGTYFVDTSLAAHAPLSVVMEGLVPFLVDALRSEGLAVDFDPHAVYSLAVEGGMPFARTLTLSECGVVDGARLLLREVRSTEVFKPIIEDGSDALAEFNSVAFPAFSDTTAHVVGLLAAAAGGGLLAALFIAGWWSTPALLWWLPLALALTVATAAGAAVAQRRRNAAPVSYALGIATVLLAFGAGWVAVPPVDGIAGHWTAANVLAGVFAAGALSLLVLWLTGVGITAHTAIIVLATASTVVAALRTFTGLDARQLGVGALLIGMILFTAAPALALWMARVRPPSLPVPGEDIDRNELDDAAMVVEVFDDTDDVRTVALSDDEDTQLERRSRVANKFLTGLFVAAVAIVAAGGIIAVRPGTHYFGGELAIAIITTLVLVLRGRSLTDRVQAITFFAGAFALLSGFTLVVVFGTGSPVSALTVILSVLAVVIAAAAAGLLLPGTKMSPITLRRIEQLEFLLILSIAPLAFWVTGAYSALRNFN
ncbi:MAG: type VII secretion integral membrane protein EccD [Actinomycetota bacterium]|nr:type VII secretion integral membrane protein EccD [Actinomycetota bacterium]MDA2950994.1 type VII secretion integral membrane protein EccD [Actinomycetota bacterium]MDA2991095.1 type VII secretion integral membrane protein EccD [Actinomycetota bacterium]